MHTRLGLLDGRLLRDARRDDGRGFDGEHFVFFLSCAFFCSVLAWIDLIDYKRGKGV